MIALACAAVLEAIWAVPCSGRQTERWETWFEVRAEVRDLRVSAELDAGGRLAMLSDPAATVDRPGFLRLTLDEVVEHPWKLYQVDPHGPLGKETKFAAVITLPRPTWAALATARTENERQATARHRRWLARSNRSRPLDGAFAFVVIGDAMDRFSFEIAPAGEVANVANRMTDRWLPGPFDAFVEAGQDSPEGYWFWNHGEEAPFAYEPHTYHAFAAALALLGSAPGALYENQSRTWHAVATPAIDVLTTLAGRAAAAHPFSESRHDTLELRETRRNLPDGGVHRTVTSAPEPSGDHIERQTVISSIGEPLADRVTVRLTGKRHSRLEVTVGYRLIDQKEESK